MRKLLHKLVYHTILRNQESISISDYRFAKAYREFWVITRSHILDFFLITAGVFSAAFGLKGFLLPNKFIDGGVTGISLLLSAITDWPLSLFLVLINLPFVVLAYRILGPIFAAKTAAAITALSIVLLFVYFPDVTHDLLLAAVFGGFFLGLGIGLTIRGGAVIDGTEVMAIALSRQFSVSIGDVVSFINVIIFMAAAYLLSLEAAMYSMITYIAASKTLDYVIEGIEEYIGVTIISPHNDEISEMIRKKMGRGFTIFSGKQGFGKRGDSAEIDILYCVLTRLEISKIKTEIDRIDSNAFVVMAPVKDTKGGMIKNRRL